MATVEH